MVVSLQCKHYGISRVGSDPLFFARLFDYVCESERNMSKITDRVWALAKPVVEEAGCTLWDVEYVREAGSWYLRVFIDKEGGVDITDCEKVSRAINTPLDELDPIENAYCLEVCSPGIERELVRDEHFIQFIGVLRQVIQCQTHFVGTKQLVFGYGDKTDHIGTGSGGFFRRDGAPVPGQDLHGFFPVQVIPLQTVESVKMFLQCHISFSFTS